MSTFDGKSNVLERACGNIHAPLATLGL